MPCQIEVQITPNATRDEVAGFVAGRWKLKVRAPAIEGKANAALLKFLARTLGLRPNRLRILRGETARIKLLEIQADPAQVEAALQACAPGSAI